MIIDRKKKIKLGKGYYNIIVNTYNNNRIRLSYINNKERHDFTINLEDVYLDDGRVFLDPVVKKDGILKELKKKRIIKDICGVINYNYIDIPIATLNMGILRKYDNTGVNNHLQKKFKVGDNFE